MSRGLTVRGLPSAPLFEAQLRSSAICPPCACGKMKRESFPLSGKRACRPLEKLHCDIAGPFKPSAGGSVWYTVIVDDYSGYRIVTPHKKKWDAADIVKSSIEHLERKYNARVSHVCSDRERVFLQKDLQSYFRSKGIEPGPTSRYSPAENGHAERAIGVLSVVLSAQTADAGISQRYWADSLMHACYLSNICSSTGGKSPWELLKGKKPDISNLHVWGCTCWVHVPSQLRHKGGMPTKAQVVKFIGYAQPNFKAFRVLLPIGNVIISRDVRFDESASWIQINLQLYHRLKYILLLLRLPISRRKLSLHHHHQHLFLILSCPSINLF
jgi:hypothetical protein